MSTFVTIESPVEFLEELWGVAARSKAGQQFKKAIEPSISGIDRRKKVAVLQGEAAISFRLAVANDCVSGKPQVSAPILKYTNIEA